MEEHGPLVAEDPLLVGELENFPQVAQLKIQEAGGFELFLLESLRFIKMGRSIGLAKHAVSLQQAGRGASLDDLDDLDVIVDPDTNDLSRDLYPPAFTIYPDDYLSAPPEVHPILPSPYIFGSHTPPPCYDSARGCTVIEKDPLYRWACDDSQEQDPCFISDGYEELDLYSSEVDDRVSENDPCSGGGASVTTEESFLRKHAASQVSANISPDFLLN